MIYPDGTPVGRYTVIPNDVLEKVDDIELAMEERKVLARIIRDTIGYEKKKQPDGTSVRVLTANLPVDRFVKKTGLPETKIVTALNSLEKRRIIRRKGDRVTFNHHLSEWY